MTRSTRTLLRASALLLALPAAGAQAPAPACRISASPNPLREHQPDGTAITLHFRGTPDYSWYEDSAGYPVLRSGDAYVYAEQGSDGELHATTMRVGAGNPRHAGLRRGGPSPAVQKRHAAKSEDGTKHAPIPGRLSLSMSAGLENLVILIRFENHGPSGQNRTLPTTTDVDTIMNAVGGDPLLAPTGSVRDFYLESSYGGLDLNSTAEGWFDVPGSETYYADASSGTSTLVHDLIVDALEAADPTVDFSLYDTDSNDVIDAITFLHSGYGAEWGGTDAYGTDSVNRIWSHKWTIPTWTSDEGIMVSEYHISPALWDITGDEPGHIGVVAHELGHFLGLPDTYDTSYGGVGDGNWCVMAVGAWGFDWSQQYPSHPSPWAKWKMGWLTAPAILPGTYLANPVETDPDVFRIQSGYPPGECILIENRQPISFDAQIPQAGLAIWHVDDAKGSIPANDVNADGGFPWMGGWPANDSHYRIALLQPDDLWELEVDASMGDAGDLYHEAGVDEILPSSSPNLDSYQGGVVTASGNHITDITTTAGSVSFVYGDVYTPTITPVVAVLVVGVPTVGTLTGSGGTGELTWSEARADPGYRVSSTGQSQFKAVGVAQGWNADDATWAHALPFAFPFYGSDHDTVYVSSNGFLDFVPGAADAANQGSHLRLARRIAPLWDDLVTTGPGEDVFIDVRQDEVEFRWRASTFANKTPCDFSVVLARDGSIEFHYGPGNTGLTPTVGISRGHSGDVLAIPGHDASTSLSSAASITLRLTGSDLPPGVILRTDGTLTGIPTQPGLYRPFLRATDTAYHYDQRQFSLRVVQRGKPRPVQGPPRGPLETSF